MMFQGRRMELFYELYDEIPRQGPGSREATERAFSLCPDLPDRPEILEIGCGCGTQTIYLAGLTKGRIRAVDIHPRFIERLAEAVRGEELEGRVIPLLGDMNKLEFPAGEFDLIWSEGSIFIVGLEKGLADWRPLLKPKGLVALSDLFWFRNDPPKDLLAFWRKEGVELIDVEAGLAICRKQGYRVVDHFPLPEECWSEVYYRPLAESVREMERKYPGDPDAAAVLGHALDEIEAFRRFSAYYGYEFIILQKTD